MSSDRNEIREALRHLLTRVLEPDDVLVQYLSGEQILAGQTRAAADVLGHFARARCLGAVNALGVALPYEDALFSSLE